MTGDKFKEDFYNQIHCPHSAIQSYTERDITELLMRNLNYKVGSDNRGSEKIMGHEGL